MNSVVAWSRVWVFVITWICSLNSFSQSVANYSITRSTGVAYNSIISSGSSLAGWRYSGSFSTDDNRSESTEIGFDFWYNGQRYTQFSVSTNGFVDFSSSADDGGPQADDYGYFNGAFSASTVANGTWLALAPFYDDMTTGAGSDPLGSSIKYQLSGTSPSRVLTIEWAGMAVYNNTTPDLNFQVKIYETSGVIEYNYGTMNAGTNLFSYTVGINAAMVNNPPTAAQLKTQQIANTSTFGNTAQNNLSVMPSSNSQIRFVPPVPADPLGSLTINSITNTGMTLNWSDWAANEVGYVLYYSTDNISYYFNSQTAANATSSVVNGLLPSTTYYWKVFAVTEGGLSAALPGSATTLAPGTIRSLSSGRWDVAGTWDCSCVPSAGDNVIIRDGHTVTLRANTMQCNDLSIGEGTSGQAQFITNNSRTLTINGNLTINNGGSFTQAINSNATHTVNFRGDIVNNGTFNLSVDANSRSSAVFTKTTGNQTISGAGAITNFYTIALDKGVKDNVVEVTSANFACDPDALNFVSGGTFRFSSSAASTFQLFNSMRSIPLNGKVWMNSANSTMIFGAGVNLSGDLQLDNGTLVVGDAADENISSSGGSLIINGGILRIAGRYDFNDTESTSSYIQTGGMVVVPTVGSTSTTSAPFNMVVAGSTLIMTGGTIVLEREGGLGGQDLAYNTSGVTVGSVTGGTLQIGNTATPSNQSFLINSGTVVGNIHLNSANATASLVSNDLTVLGNVTLSLGSLNDGGRNITFGGNWLTTAGSFIATATGTVVASGAAQSITVNGSAFNHLTLVGSSSKSFQDNLVVNGDLVIGAVMVPVNSGFVCTLGGDWLNNASFVRNDETIILNGVTDQIFSGSSVTDLTNISVNKSGGSVLINGKVNLYGVINIQSSTTLDGDGSGSGVLTIISAGDEPTADGSIGPLSAGAAVTGNVTVQRYMAPEVPGVTKVYRYISSPVSGQFVSDWQDDFPITGTFTDPSAEFPVGSGITSFCGRTIIPTSPSLYWYMESNSGTGTSDMGWVRYPASGLSSAAPLEVGLGYAAFIRDCTNPTLVDVRGPVNQGAVSFNSLVSLTNNGDLEDGFNLIGNPYPSAIDWNNDAGWTRTGISSVMYIRDNGGSGGYITYDYTDNAPMVIAMGQAFWVRVTGTPNFSINEQAKTTDPGVFYRSAVLGKLTLSLTKGTVTDKAILKINPESTGRLDDFDGPKMDNALFDISTLSEDGISMAVNSLAKIECGKRIAVRTKDLTMGTYDMSFDLTGVLREYDITLFDKYANAEINLKEVSDYTFIVNSALASQALDRFELKFSLDEIDQDLTISSVPSICEGQDATVIIQNSQPGVDYYATTFDAVITNWVRGNGADVELNIPAASLVGETNQIIVKATNACGQVFDMFNHIELTKMRLQEPVVLEQMAQCKEGNVTLAVQNVSNTLANWYEDKDSSVPLFTGNRFETPRLSKSKTYYVSMLSSVGCESGRVAVKATIISFDDVQILQSGDTLISSYQEGNQWYFNDKPIANGTSDFTLALIPGTYRVVVDISNECNTVADKVVENSRSETVTATDEELVKGLLVYPNPTQDTFEIIVNRDFDDLAEVTDLVGNIVLTIPLFESGNSKLGQGNLQSLPSGVYIVRCTKSTQVEVFKLMKQ